MNRLFFLITLLFFALFSGFPLNDSAKADAQEKLTGHKVARQIFDRDRGNNSSSTATMVLINKKNKKRSRTFTSTRILENGLEKQLTRFTSPADIDGTGFLTIEKTGYETDQFLYLPALRRTRRIVSSQKSHRFVNSDFTYEDMERHPVDNYIYELKGERTIEGIDCYILETRPNENVESQYSLTKSLVSKTSFVPISVDYFDKKGRPVKKYKVMKLEQKQNIWTESIVMMEDLIKNHKTFIKILKIEYNTDISSGQISKTSLENY